MVAVAYPKLQPYLPRLVREWADRGSDTLVREIEGSIVFVDVSGFTRMSERLARQGKVGAEEVSDVIGDTFSTLLAEAYMYGGSLLKFGGDALLLFFSGDGNALRATAAAYGMRRELRGNGTFTTTAGKVTLRMSVGAHAGVYHFFLLGDSHRELVVAGPAATRTVLMESAASAGQILLSPEFAAMLPAANRGAALGPGVLLAGTPPTIDRMPVERVSTEIDLTHYVPVGLRETVLAGDVEPEHRSVTVAFVQYAGLDELVLREGAAAAAKALDVLVRSVQRTADAHGVTFLATDIAPDGGKIILTAGAPQATGSDDERMLLSLSELLSHELPLSLRIGVNTGPVFAGEIGPSYRRTYTVMGDAVNLAARLMAKAEPGHVLCTPAVLDGSRTLFETTELEPFLVKGKKKPVQAFTVSGARGSRASIAEAGLPLVGREAELSALLDAWESARGGTGRLVEVSADPGMGKSRLLDELLDRVEGARVMRSECRLYQSATAYFPFRSLLRSAFELEESDDRSEIDALEKRVDESAPSLRPWLSLIATPLDLDVEPSPEVQQLEEEFRRSRLEDAVAALVAAVATDPAMVIVEDTHWMDEPSRGLLARVTDALRDSPWLVVLSRRPGEDGFVAPADSESLLRIELRPLGVEQATALIHEATERSPLMPEQVRALAERAAGNPLFLIELLDALRRGGDVEALPHSIEGLIQARIDHLAPPDRRRLRSLSVLGAGFRVEHATAALAGGAPERVSTSLRRLGDFVSVNRSGWVQFRHALIRDAAYEGLPYRRRQKLHAQVGDSILEAAGGRPEDQAELLSLHYSFAGRWSEAWRYSRIAGDRARDVYANLEAARFYERALAAAHRLPRLDPHEPVVVATRLCEVRERAGLFEAALVALRRARRLAGDDPVALADIHLRRARVLIRKWSLRAAYRETTRGSRLVASVPGGEAATIRARLTGLSSNIRLLTGRPGDARVLAERALAEAEAAGDLSELAHAYAMLDDAYVDLGQRDKAVFARRAIEIYSTLGHLTGIAAVENSIGVRAYAEGDWNLAVAAYLRSQDASRRAGDEANAAAQVGNIGEVLVSQRRLDEAEAILVEASRVQRAHGLVGPALFAEIQFGRLSLERGEIDDAVLALAQTHQEAVTTGSRFLALETTVHLAVAYTRRGEAERALALLGDAEELAGELTVSFAASLARARAEALLALSRWDEAASVIAAGLTAARERDGLYDEAQLLLLSATLARQHGGGDGAEALQQAERLLQRLGVLSVG